MKQMLRIGLLSVALAGGVGYGDANATEQKFIRLDLVGRVHVRTACFDKETGRTAGWETRVDKGSYRACRGDYMKIEDSGATHDLVARIRRSGGRGSPNCRDKQLRATISLAVEAKYRYANIRIVGGCGSVHEVQNFVWNPGDLTRP